MGNKIFIFIGGRKNSNNKIIARRERGVKLKKLKIFVSFSRVKILITIFTFRFYKVHIRTNSINKKRAKLLSLVLHS